MAEAPASTSAEDDLPVVWKLSNRRSRKSGCSNIFSGVNLQQLHRLLRTAGDSDSEHHAKLVWQEADTDMEGAEEEKEGEERQDEKGLAQAFVGLRVRARNKAGIRAEGHRDPKWLGASRLLRFKEPSSGYAFEDEEVDLEPCPEELLLVTEKDTPEIKNPFKPSTWRLDVGSKEGARDSECYLHRILH